MEQAQLPVVIGFLVSLAFQCLKRLWPGLDNSPAIVKQVTAATVAAVLAWQARGWGLSSDVLLPMAYAAISALATHRVLLQTPTTEGTGAK